MRRFFLQAGSELITSTQKETHKLFNWADRLEDDAISFAPKVLAALFLLLIGYWLIKWVSRIFIAVLNKRQFDPTLKTFLSSIIRVGLYVLLFVTVISVLGVDVTSFAALLAGAGLAIGAALNGSLGNLAGGVMILIMKPFKVGDLIQSQEYFGIVKGIGIAYTTILTSQNRTIHLPNGNLSTGVITNYTEQENLRIDIKLPIADLTDFDKAKKIAVDAMLTHPNVIKDPAPDVKIIDLTGDGPVIVLWPRIQIKPYDKDNPRQMEADYYSVFFGVRELVYKAFVQNGIATPDSTLQVTMMDKHQ
ncbi:MAG: mechanosensitive ion channel family protein [Chitinophagaceae bacterium]|nr:mechanosensitive ion channel family protein [Chitinophagaceae bacterium]